MGEPGSSINITNTAGATINTSVACILGPFRDAQFPNYPVDTATELYLYNVNITYNGNHLGFAVGFYGCYNLYNCHSTINTRGNIHVYRDCSKLVNCTAIGRSTNGGCLGYGYCTDLANCSADSTGNSYVYNTEDAAGFWACWQLSNCRAKSFGISARGFNSCRLLSNWHAVAEVNPSAIVADSFAYGFADCHCLSTCRGQGTIDRNLYSAGFLNCSRLFGCVGVPTARTNNTNYLFSFKECRTGFGNRSESPGAAPFSLCYMHHISDLNPWANTAAGGYNYNL